MRLPFLDPDRPVFPAPERAARSPNGLLAAGGNLTVATLRDAYQHGIFPWFEPGQPPLWWSPDPRAVFFPDQVHVSRTMARLLRRGRYRITSDQCFGAVIRRCTAPRGGQIGTWIVPEMIAAYEALHAAGDAHSVECWIDGELAGGLYGVAVGSVFCGESMFSVRANASKLALIHLARGLSAGGFTLIDCQIGNPHLASMGAMDIPRTAFLTHLVAARERLLRWPAGAISAMVGSNAAIAPAP
ncbi:MAG: leucyl/phenylalanyl-tRNA--protein transferase [Porticoccaceae bacterium]